MMRFSRLAKLFFVAALVVMVLPGFAADPAGTNMLKMHNAANGKTMLSTIYVDEHNNFTGALFVPQGKINDLNDIKSIPHENFNEKVAALPGTGVVALARLSNENGSVYYRIYVEKYILNIKNEIIGVEIKYQMPFLGKGSGKMELERDRVEFSSSGGENDVHYKIDKEQYSVYTYSPQEWIHTYDYGTDEEGWSGGISIKVDPSTDMHDSEGYVRITNSVTDEEKRIVVTRRASREFFRIICAVWPEFNGDGSPAYADMNRIPVNTNLPWLASSDSDWCTVSNYSTYYNTRDYAYVWASQNLTGKERTAIVTFKTQSGGYTYEAKVIQKPMAVSMSHSLFNLERKAFVLSPTIITSLASWTAESDADWCVVSWNNKVMNVRVAANDTGRNRTATVTVMTPDGQKTPVTINQSRYAVGDYYNEDGVEGVIFEMNGLHGKMVSLEYNLYVPWSTEKILIGASDKMNGMANMEVVKKIPGWQQLYPAFYWCDQLNKNGNEGWYLPAHDELSAIKAREELINGTLAEIAVKKVMDKKYKLPKDDKEFVCNILRKGISASYDWNYKTGKSKRGELIEVVVPLYNSSRISRANTNISWPLGMMDKKLEKSGARKNYVKQLPIIYWTSSEVDASSAAANYQKYQSGYVRAVRKF